MFLLLLNEVPSGTHEVQVWLGVYITHVITSSGSFFPKMYIQNTKQRLYMEGDNNTEVDTECGTANKSHVSIKKKKKKKKRLG